MSNLICHRFRSYCSLYLLHWTPTPQFGASCGGIASLNVWVYITVRSPVDSKASCGFGTSRLAIPQLLPWAISRAKVISAIFLKDTLDAANNDAEQAVVEQLQKKKQYVAWRRWRRGAGADDSETLALFMAYLWHIYGIFMATNRWCMTTRPWFKKWVHFQWETVRNGSTNPIVYCRVWKHKSKGLSNDELGLSRSKVVTDTTQFENFLMNITWR